MNNVDIFVLGAGQDVGRSCIIIKIYDRTIMLDCGCHMGFSDSRRFPDFKLLNPDNKKSFDQIIDLVLISHFHLDHCGALPIFTEHCNYNGPILMTSPTKALLPYMLEDYQKVASDSNSNSSQQSVDQSMTTVTMTSNSTNTQSQQQLKQISQQQMNLNQQQQQKPQSSQYNQISQQINQSDNTNKNHQISQQIIEKASIYTREQIKQCVQKVTGLQLHETVEVKDIKIKTYYAGHVLGAAMLLIEYRGIKVLYTGDFNSNSDRHLGAAVIDKVHPDILITETTYATTIRDSKRLREREFLQQVQETIDKGGKVLIPVFALGRAQELCILLDTYWNRVKNTVPIYFAAGLIEKANFFYKLFVTWTNEKIQQSFLSQNMFDFKHIHPFDKQLIKANHPMVLFATPGMLHGGLSLQVFKEWASDEKNTLIIPGFCVAGTLGNRILSGAKELIIDKKTVQIKMKVCNMSFSAHADAKGILGLIRHCQPKNVVFVHGELKKMEILAETVKQQFNLPVFLPANFENINVVIQPSQSNNSSFITQSEQVEIASAELVAKLQAGQLLKESSQAFCVCTMSDQEMESSQVNRYSMVSSFDELAELIKLMQDQSNQSALEFVDHSISEGYLIPLSKKLIQNYANPETKDIQKNTLIKGLEMIMETVLKKHSKTKDDLLDYKDACSLDLENNQFLVLKYSPYLDREKMKKVNLIYELLLKYNNEC